CALAALAAALLAVAALSAAPAGAESFGQLEAWGAIGSGPGELFRPTELGVDPGADPDSAADDSVYVLDSNAGHTEWRLQKFDSSGTLLASATIPIESGSALLGVAVDPHLERVYLLQLKEGLDTVTGEQAAERILVFSTVPSG